MLSRRWAVGITAAVAVAIALVIALMLITVHGGGAARGGY